MALVEVPPPGSAHPDLERSAYTIRQLMRERRHVKVFRPRLTNYWDDPERKIIQEVIILTPKTHYGLAPYVGEPFIYTWNSVSDDLYWVTDHTRIVYVPEDMKLDGRF